jgi:FKBP-type peptidyl-prolyl cis-trans isomerase SlyD
MPQTIEKDTVAILSFTAKDEASDEVLEHIPTTAYLHGHDNFPKGLEDALEGLEAGAAFDVVVAEAFGPKTDKEQSVRKGDLPKGLRDRLRVGLSFAADGSGGEQHVLWVKAIKGGRVTITADHPYAGKDIRFTGQVVQLRVPTAGELEHGHAHGPGGHHNH